ncbi:MAG TPA: alpha/beta hydrolase family protein [Solirubrobacteraceae bacterium]
MATFVLVHGAWHGGWCWRRVAAPLRAAGHEVHAPTLTGLGERAHLLGRHVDLATHVQDVAQLLFYEDLREVVLVGHSYGGMVIAGVAERAPERLAQLVYLDAFVPLDGRSMLDLFPARARAETLERARVEGDGWRSPPRDEAEPFGVVDPADAAWVRSRLTAHPVATWTQPLRLSSRAAAGLPRTFVECTATRWFGQYAARARSEPGWAYRELPTGHDAMITMPRELADLLRRIAEQPGH